MPAADVVRIVTPTGKKLHTLVHHEDQWHVQDPAPARARRDGVVGDPRAGDDLYSLANRYAIDLLSDKLAPGLGLGAITRDLLDEVAGPRPEANPRRAGFYPKDDGLIRLEHGVPPIAPDKLCRILDALHDNGIGEVSTDTLTRLICARR